MTKPNDNRSVETLLANVRNALDELEAKIKAIGGVIVDAVSAGIPQQDPST